MQILKVLVSDKLKSLIPGNRNRTNQRYAALLAELNRDWPGITFGATNGVPWLQLPDNGPRLHGFWSDDKHTALCHQLQHDLPPNLAPEYFRLARDFVTRYSYPHLRPDTKPIGYPVEQLGGFHGQHKDAIPDLEDATDRAELSEAFRPKPGETILDCGAFLGFGDLKVAADIGDGRIFAVEAASACHALLKTNVEWNGISNVVPIHGGIWDGGGGMSLERGEAQANTLVREISEGQSRELIPSMSIDMLVAQRYVGRAICHRSSRHDKPNLKWRRSRGVGGCPQDANGFASPH